LLQCAAAERNVGITEFVGDQGWWGWGDPKDAFSDD
jgi:hypothetical protein